METEGEFSIILPATCYLFNTVTNSGIKAVAQPVQAAQEWRVFHSGCGVGNGFSCSGTCAGFKLEA